MKQTAVEWLYEETLGITLQLEKRMISHRTWELQMVKLFKQAKEMEKKQIINAYLKSKRKRADLLGALKIMDEAEQYYNETFKSETIVTEYRDGSIDVETFKSE